MLIPLAVLLAARSSAAVIQMDPGRVLNSFRPDTSFGAGVDGHESGSLARIYTPRNLKAMRSAGLRSLTYRLRTELGIKAWHWNPQGSWSDPVHQQGYWTSSAKPGKFIRVCWGYELPRRGSTYDQADNDGYSRVDDGDLTTFWKSNPYLDRYFTHEDDAKHPQWLVIDFNDKVSIDTARITWGTPYAVHYRLDYWDGPPRVNEVDPTTGSWKSFPEGEISDGHGGVTTLRLSQKPIKAQYVRLWLFKSSLTAPRGSHDVRDKLGFAVREMSLGSTDKEGHFRDRIRHGKSKGKQTEFIASSTDPWHRATDRAPKVEQPGFDLVFHCGLTNGLPCMMPVPVLYDTPDNTRAEIQWLKARGYPVTEIEMGEEPDGQNANPADYAALYLQMADVIREVNPGLKLGGPCFQTTQLEYGDWPERPRETWLGRFLGFMEGRRRMRDFQFFSFEWYPWDDVLGNTTTQLLRHPKVFADTMARLEKAGLKHDVPWMITEYGYSAFAGPPEVELPGALLNAETVAQFLQMGGNVSYLYGYEPAEVIQEHPGAWGQLTMLLPDEFGQATYKLPTYWGAWLQTHAWAMPGSGLHRLIAASSSSPYVEAFPLQRPDGRLAIMLLNKDPRQTYRTSLKLGDRPLSGPAIVYSYGKAQYKWIPARDEGHPAYSKPPVRSVTKDASTLELPPSSIAVVIK